MKTIVLLFAGALGAAGFLRAQDSTVDSDDRHWSIHFQATSIGQHHGWFPSLYEGSNSLPAHPESRVSLTTTAYFSYRANAWLELVLSPEVAGGKGFGQVTGIAGFTNGEIPRVAGATPTLYLARGYVRNTWAHFTLITGKFAISDYFDNNRYSHDPRRQFMNWALMSNGAWDYPADTRGYTMGSVQELNWTHWAIRSAVILVPTEANGSTLDTRIGRNRGVVVEGESRYRVASHPGALRVLAFDNRERAGTYRQAALVDGVADLGPTRRPGSRKYGWGVNIEQELPAGLGLFGRYGWNDGKTESWAFTEIDRSVSGGAVFSGRWWHRTADQVGLAAVRNQLSGDHRAFLAAGGSGFILGDGRLNYAPENVAEIYYAWHLLPEWTLTLDYQRVVNPAYNHDRGPVSVGTLRVHWER